MRRTKEDAELTRQAVLDAALQVMSRRGYAGTRLEDIARAAKVTRGAIYHHFPGKPELFAALVDDATEVGNRAVARAIAEGGDFLGTAERILIYTIDLMAQESMPYLISGNAESTKAIIEKDPAKYPTVWSRVKPRSGRRSACWPTACIGWHRTTA